MSRGVRVSMLVALALVVAAVGLVALRLTGGGVPNPGWSGVVLLVFMAVGVFFAGLPVRRLRLGRPGKPVSPLRAARTLVLAQAAALTGAGLIGWYAAQAISLSADLDIESQRARVWLLGGHAAAAVLLVVCGLITQRNCRLDGDDHDPPGDRTP